MNNASILLGNHFDQFVNNQVAAGRYNNISEVIQAGLRLLEEEENKAVELKNAVQEGIDSGTAHYFDPKKNLEMLKARQFENKIPIAQSLISITSFEQISKPTCI